MNWQRDDYFISTDKELLDFPLIFRFISEEAYWGQGRSEQTMRAAITHSTFCFGLYQQLPDERVQVGFARVISDLAVFGYLSDVFVVSEHRGKGLGQWLVKTICEHPDIRDLKRFTLITRTPKFYESLSFAVNDPDDIRKFMIRKKQTR